MGGLASEYAVYLVRTGSGMTFRNDIQLDMWINAIDVLFPYVRLEGFLDFYPSRPVVYHGELARLVGLDDAAFDDATALIKLAANDVLTTYVRCPSGRIRQALLDRKQAATMYDEGMTVGLEGVQRTFPQVAQWARALRRELGYGPTAAGVAMLVSAPGDAVPMHFDSLDVLIVHLRGTKRWSIAENTTFPEPDFSYFPTEGGGGSREDSDENDARVPAVAWPTRFPETAQTFDMVPGSVAFVPRGWWHMTYAETPTVSLTFKLPSTIAYQHVLGAMAAALRATRPWRESVGGLWAESAPHRARARAKLAALQAMLAEAMGIGATVGDGLWRRHVDAYVDVVGGTVVVTVSGREHSTEPGFDATRLCAALRNARGAFVQDDLMDFVPLADEPAARRLIVWLTSVGAIARIEDAPGEVHCS
jgi:hypothetical protein